MNTRNNIPRGTKGTFTVELARGPFSNDVIAACFTTRTQAERYAKAIFIDPHNWRVVEEP